MNKESALAVLQNALDRCRNEDVRTPEVFAALDFLAAQATEKWPFDQFRKALENPGSEGWEVQGRWQILNASLNGIRRAASRQLPCGDDRNFGDWCRCLMPTKKKSPGTTHGAGEVEAP